jgi:glycosyltransferase involved in cell wall biosynthesis
MRLLCIGGGIFSSDEVDSLNKLDLNGLVTQKNVDDSGLIGFYQNALALIMPSLYEGFGFPIVEAMSNKCPVILNKNSCFPEVAGIAGCFYEADNIDQFQYAVESVLRDRSYRANLVELGLENAKKFTWENCVTETSKAILSLKKE